MKKIGFIGTSWITIKQVEATKLLGYEATVIFSRDKIRAALFAAEYKIANFITDIKDFAKYNLDGVYVASPFPIHYEQAKQLLEMGISVLCEKPLTVKLWETEDLIETAKKNNVRFLEAFRPAHNPHSAILQEYLKNYKVKSANFYFEKKSSQLTDERYLTASTFQKDMFGGAHTDLGIYPIEVACILFGDTTSSKIHVNEWFNQVPGTVSISMKHTNGVNTNIVCSKLYDGKLENTIELEDGSIIKIDNISRLTKATHNEKVIFDYEHKNDMTFQMYHFINLKSLHKYNEYSKQGIKILEDLIKQVS